MVTWFLVHNCLRSTWEKKENWGESTEREKTNMRGWMHRMAKRLKMNRWSGGTPGGGWRSFPDEQSHVDRTCQLFIVILNICPSRFGKSGITYSTMLVIHMTSQAAMTTLLGFTKIKLRFDHIKNNCIFQPPLWKGNGTHAVFVKA